jgi:hypothetical protein
MALVCLTARGQEGPARFGYILNELKYPQKTPEEALQSVVKAIEAGQVSYLMAQLADPDFVDAKVAEYKKNVPGNERARMLQAFVRLVKETDDHFQEDPLLAKELKRFSREGEWKTEGASAVATCKTVPGRNVFMKKLQNRWYLENKQN